ncbi:hypothetical protein ACFVXG_30775 [Kitasatospora sp. NPDC058162]|uniref:hypothetical protein n=1 Tax=Kitasatospora sp. NPDC058162 TaxID=3346362 RepID=UPI0036DACBEF
MTRTRWGRATDPESVAWLMEDGRDAYGSILFGLLGLALLGATAAIHVPPRWAALLVSIAAGELFLYWLFRDRLAAWYAQQLRSAAGWRVAVGWQGVRPRVGRAEQMIEKWRLLVTLLSVVGFGGSLGFYFTDLIAHLRHKESPFWFDLTVGLTPLLGCILWAIIWGYLKSSRIDADYSSKHY